MLDIEVDDFPVVRNFIPEEFSDIVISDEARRLTAKRKSAQEDTAEDIGAETRLEAFMFNMMRNPVHQEYAI